MKIKKESVHFFCIPKIRRTFVCDGTARFAALVFRRDNK